MKFNLNDSKHSNDHQLSHDYLHEEEHEKYEALKMTGNILLLVLLIGFIAMMVDQVINFVYFHVLTLF
jgi:hypothetical protein